MGSLEEFNDLNFRDEVLMSLMPVLVMFRTEWSGDSQILNLILEKIAVDYENELKIGNLLINKNEHTAYLYSHISEVPTLLLFKRGELFWKHIGLISYKKLNSDLKIILREINAKIGHIEESR